MQTVIKRCQTAAFVSAMVILLLALLILTLLKLQQNSPSASSSLSSLSPTKLEQTSFLDDELQTRRVNKNNTEEFYYLQSLNVLPAVPFSNQKARLSTFKKIQQLQNTPKIQKLFETRKDYCTRKYGKDYSRAVKKFERRLHRNMKQMKASRKSYPLFRFRVHNFNNDDEEKDVRSHSRQIGFAGHRRVFVSLVWNDGSKDPVCVGGAVIEGALQSDNDRVDIDYFIDSSTVADKERIELSTFKAASFGLYEIQPFIRRSGNYKLCLALNAINPRNKWQFTQQMVDRSSNNDNNNNNNNTERDDFWWSSSKIKSYPAWYQHQSGKLDSAGEPVTCQRQSYTSRECFDSDLWSDEKIDRESVRTVQKLLRNQRQKNEKNTDETTANSLLYRGGGAWTRVKWRSSCFIDEFGNFIDEENDPSLTDNTDNTKNSNNNNNKFFFRVCRGLPRYAYPTEGLLSNASVANSVVEIDDNQSHIWVFISDTAIVEFFNRKSSWDLVNKHWILYWGGSTLKQPAVNFLEYNLGVPVFEKSMEQLKEIAEHKRRPLFHHYRQWEVAVSSKKYTTGTSRSSIDDDHDFKQTLCWSGCKNLLQNMNCGSEIGLSRVLKENRLHDCIEETLSSPTLRRKNSLLRAENLQKWNEMKRQKHLAKLERKLLQKKSNNKSNQSSTVSAIDGSGGSSSSSASDGVTTHSSTMTSAATRTDEPLSTIVAPSPLSSSDNNMSSSSQGNFFKYLLPPDWPDQQKTSTLFDDTPSLPSVLILNHFVWRHPLYSIPETIKQINVTLQLLEKKICENYYEKDENKLSSSFKLPILIWISGVRYGYSDLDSSNCYSDDQRLFLRMLNWRIDSFMQNYISQFYRKAKKSNLCVAKLTNDKMKQKREVQVFKDVVFVGRHELTSPIHFGGKFVHLTSHYSSGVGACKSGEERFTATKSTRLYARKNCVKNTAGDLMLIQWLLNILKKYSTKVR